MGHAASCGRRSKPSADATAIVARKKPDPVEEEEEEEVEERKEKKKEKRKNPSEEFQVKASCNGKKVIVRGVKDTTSVREVFRRICRSGQIPEGWTPRALEKNGVRMKLDLPEPVSVRVAKVDQASRSVGDLSISETTPFVIFAAKLRADCGEEARRRRRLSAVVEGSGLRFGGTSGPLIRFAACARGEREVGDDPKTFGGLEVVSVASLDMCPAEWKRECGILVCVGDLEAVSLELFCGEEPVALRLSSGETSLITGLEQTRALSRSPKDHVISPPQRSIAFLHSGQAGVKAQIVPRSAREALSFDLQVTPLLSRDATFTTDGCHTAGDWEPWKTPKDVGLRQKAEIFVRAPWIGRLRQATIGDFGVSSESPSLAVIGGERPLRVVVSSYLHHLALQLPATEATVGKLRAAAAAAINATRDEIELIRGEMAVTDEATISGDPGSTADGPQLQFLMRHSGQHRTEATKAKEAEVLSKAECIWDLSRSARVRVRIVSAQLFEKVTGRSIRPLVTPEKIEQARKKESEKEETEKEAEKEEEEEEEEAEQREAGKEPTTEKEEEEEEKETEGKKHDEEKPPTTEQAGTSKEPEPEVALDPDLCRLVAKQAIQSCIPTLQQAMASQDGNVIASPVALYGSLFSALLGARDSTLDDIARALHIEKGSPDTAGVISSVIRAVNSKQLTVALAISKSSSIALRDSFVASCEPLDASIVEGLDEANRWASKVTRGRISTMTDSLSSDAISLLSIASAVIRLDGDVVRKEAPFEMTDGSSLECQFVEVTARLQCAELPTCQVVVLPCADDLELTIAIPNQSTKLEDAIAEVLIATQSGDLPFVEKTARVSIPELSAGWSGNLGLELGSAMTPFASFEPMSDTPCTISEVTQRTRTFIRAASSSVEEGKTEASPEIVIQAARPFFFSLAHKVTRMCLMLGRILDPFKDPFEGQAPSPQQASAEPSSSKVQDATESSDEEAPHPEEAFEVHQTEEVEASTDVGHE